LEREQKIDKAGSAEEREGTLASANPSSL